MDESLLAQVLVELRRTNQLLEEQARNVQASTRWQADRTLRQLLRDPRLGYAKRLEHAGYKVFSENGEDGMIQEIFRRIGTTNRRFVEFGVSGGIECNTHLLLHLGWSGLWIEAQENWARFINENFSEVIAEGRLAVRNEFVTSENIDEILTSSGFEGEIDLLSVDIDGNDYYVCESITAVSPRVIVVEYNSSFPPPLQYVNRPSRPDGLCFGASLSALTDMFRTKGYALVGCDLCGVNAFFVRRDVIWTEESGWDGRFVDAGYEAPLYNPPRYGLSVGYPRGHYPPVAWNPGKDLGGTGPDEGRADVTWSLNSLRIR